MLLTSADGGAAAEEGVGLGGMVCFFNSLLKRIQVLHKAKFGFDHQTIEM